MGNTKLNNVQAAVQFGDLAEIQEVYELLHRNTGPPAVTFSSTYRTFWRGRFVESTNGKKPHTVAPTAAYVPQYIAPPYPIPQLVPVTTATGQVMLVPIATVPIAPPLIMDQPGIAQIGMYPPYGPYAVPGPPPPQMVLNSGPNAMIHNSFESTGNPNHVPMEPIHIVKVTAESSNYEELPHANTIHDNFVEDKINTAVPEALQAPYENGIHENLSPPVEHESSNGVHDTIENSFGLTDDNMDDNLAVGHDEIEAIPLNGVEEFISIETGSSKVAESNASDENHMSHNNLPDNNAEATKLCDEIPAAVPKPKPTLWSQLFSSTAASANVQYSPVTTDVAEIEEKTAELDLSEKIARDQFTYFIYEKMRKLSLKSLPRVLHLNPRGMNNFGNRCYMHSALQVLIHLPQFYYLLISFPERPARDVPLSTTPILDALKDFSQNFHLYKQDGWMTKAKSTRMHSTDFSIETAFTVQTLVKSLMNHKMFAQGQQEDVEEFLFFILDSLHEELSAVDNVYNRSSSGSAKDGVGSVSSMLSAATANGDSSAAAFQYQNGGACSSNNSEAGYSSQGGAGGETDEWISMGPRRRERIMRETDLRESLITDLFGGTLMSEVRKKGSRNSCTTQRFFTMRLDIDQESIRSLKDALVASFVKEVIPQGGNKQQEITKISYLNKLPETLILQLKLFVYNAKERSAEKLNKLVIFEEVLEIPTSCFAMSSSRWATGSSASSTQQRSNCYKLFAVIYHHGQDANKGHYSAAIFHTGQKTWFQFDDAHVNKIELSNVLNPDINVKVPYLLIYRKFN